MILIVDDEAVVRRVVARFLKGLGHACREAQGAAALKKAVAQEKPRAVICDIGLGDGDGIQACLELRRRLVLPILLMTGDPEQAQRGRAAGFEVLLKPFTREELEAGLRRVLGLD